MSGSGSLSGPFTAPRCNCVNFTTNLSPFSALTGLIELPDLTRPMARVAACLITVRAALLVMLDVLRVVKEASFVPPPLCVPWCLVSCYEMSSGPCVWGGASFVQPPLCVPSAEPLLGSNTKCSRGMRLRTLGPTVNLQTITTNKKRPLRRTEASRGKADE